jgi:hypothetical protein
MEAYSVLLPAGTPCSESQPTRCLDVYARLLHCRASSLTVSFQMSMYAMDCHSAGRPYTCQIGLACHSRTCRVRFFR